MSQVVPASVAFAATSASNRPAPSILRVEGLTKTFAVRRSWRELAGRPWGRALRTTAVNAVSFEVGPAEFFGLLGANGAGKTTLFKMLATHLLPDSGSATVAGLDVVRSPREVRSVLTPVVADERSLDWRLTARENLQLFATLYGLRDRASDTRVSELLETVELSETSNQLVGAFSSGMKQRLLIARALLARPRVLLLDEPTRSLDPLSARRFRRFLREEIAGRQQCAVLLATHNAEEAFELCDRVGILDRGRLLAVGRAEDLMRESRDDRYQVSVREAQVESLIRLVNTVPGADTRMLHDCDPPGWRLVELGIPRGLDGAAELLASIARAGIGISRFARMNLSLADLLERVVLDQRHATDA